MSLEDKMRIKFGKIPKPPKKPSTPRTRKLTVPESVKISWKQISKSIESAWGKIQKDGTRKWDSKYDHYIIFKNWFEKVSK
ncbi:hypothetical protein LCGC14_1016660 [marine sediment metagenome]|uniref:Uncharacterized protein n=1 Tax=marine sediment metagenome TaxID=412755 RepID=A0A0F9QGV2_9ZZZZ